LLQYVILTLCFYSKLLPLYTSYRLELSLRVFRPQGYMTHEFNPSYESVKGGRKNLHWILYP